MIGGNPAWYAETGNFREFLFPTNVAAIGFVDTALDAVQDFRLLPTSAYKGAASDGADIGADIDAILAAIH